MNSDLQKAFDELCKSGWKITQNRIKDHWPKVINSRYPWMPLDLRTALLEVKEVVGEDETSWLLTSTDYSGQSESAFVWNEWEVSSLEAAEGDPEWIKQIQTFWDQHLPIAMSVQDGYSYYALQRDGTVVYGSEPEFEETSFFASSYRDFLCSLARLKK